MRDESVEQPTMYTEFAGWWPLLSRPEDYKEEVAFFLPILQQHGSAPQETLLELGSGGGNNAYYLKNQYRMTLVDRSAEMLAVSRELNPDCRHVQGDMRDIRLGERFDAIFVHDAVMYMLTEADLRAAIETAYVHCRPGGMALFVPDHTRETYAPSTHHGGHDGAARGMRFLAWTHDPDPADTTVVTDYAYLLREADGSVRVAHDRHVTGLFPEAVWLRLLTEVGFEPRIVVDPFERSLFICRKSG